MRQYFREIRAEIPVVMRQEAANRAAQLFTQHPTFKESQHIACYLAAKYEMDCSPIIKTICQVKKQCYLPVLSDNKESPLLFVPYQMGDPLHLNRYSILEPVNISQPIDLQSLDLVIMPLVAFDRQRHRLGAGGGYYDRAFESAEGRPFMMGLGYAAQEVEGVPFEAWDVGMDGVITEKEII